MTEQTGAKSFEEQTGEAMMLYLDGKLTDAALRARLERLAAEDPEGLKELQERYARYH